MKLKITYNCGGEVVTDEHDHLEGQTGMHPQGAPFYVITDTDHRIHYYHLQDVIMISHDIPRIKIPAGN